MNAPGPGDVVYVDTDLHVTHGVDDFRGGKATVSAVRPAGDRAAGAAWIEVSENPGMWYNWALLAERQTELAAEFGDQWAHPDPDHRPEFNAPANS